jgi:hypothetical protein
MLHEAEESLGLVIVDRDFDYCLFSLKLPAALSVPRITGNDSSNQFQMVIRDMDNLKSRHPEFSLCALFPEPSASGA